MRTSYFYFLCFLTISFFACQPKTEDACATFHWGYEAENGPEVWGDCIAACNGTSQSPVDITNPTVDGTLSLLQKNYAATPIHFVHNGHAIELEYEAGSTLQLNGKTYALKQAHFHGGSEHTVNGHRRPLEIHLVHQAVTDTNDLAVIGIFIIEDTAPNTFLSYFADSLPQHEHEHFESEDTINIADFFPASQDYYTYSGSLTTPKCSEIVTWIVMKEPVKATAEQIGKFTSVLQTSYRPTQNLNGRTVKEFRQ